MATCRRICRIRVLAENSPVCRIRVLAKMAAISAILAGLDTFARHSPTTFPGLDTFDRHSPTPFPGLDTFDTRYIRRHSPNCDSHSTHSHE